MKCMIKNCRHDKIKSFCNYAENHSAQLFMIFEEHKEIITGVFHLLKASIISIFLIPNSLFKKNIVIYG